MWRSILLVPLLAWLMQPLVHRFTNYSPLSRVCYGDDMSFGEGFGQWRWYNETRDATREQLDIPSPYDAKVWVCVGHDVTMILPRGASSGLTGEMLYPNGELINIPNYFKITAHPTGIAKAELMYDNECVKITGIEPGECSFHIVTSGDNPVVVVKILCVVKECKPAQQSDLKLPPPNHHGVTEEEIAAYKAATGTEDWRSHCAGDKFVYKFFSGEEVLDEWANRVVKWDESMLRLKFDLETTAESSEKDVAVCRYIGAGEIEILCIKHGWTQITTNRSPNVLNVIVRSCEKKSNITEDTEHPIPSKSPSGKDDKVPTQPPPPPPPKPPKVSQVTRGLSGLYFGMGTVKNWGHTQTSERLDATGTLTNQLSDSGDPIGGGLSTGFNFAPWRHTGKKGWERMWIGPFTEFAPMNQTINRTFAGGTFIGTTTHWSATTGAKVGFNILGGLNVYGLTGLSWLNEDQNIYFGGPATSSKTTIPGFTFGPGVEYQPSILQGFGLPISVYAQYQHTWWGDAHNNTPAASPAFNYTNGREDDTVKFGVNVFFH